MNKRELKRMRRSFEKGREALFEYADLLKPEDETEKERLHQAGIDAINTLAHLTDKEFTFVMSTIGCAVLASSIAGVNKEMRSMEEEKKK